MATRRFIKRNINFPLALLALMACSLTTHQFVNATQTTQASPGMTFQLIDGRKLVLEDLSGRPVFITFWATSCRSCVEEIPLLSRLYRELSPHGLEIIAVAMPYDRPDFVLQMKNELAIPYPIALDLQGEAVKAFDIRFTPNSFLLDEGGNIIKHYAGVTDLQQLTTSIKTIVQRISDARSVQ